MSAPRQAILGRIAAGVAVLPAATPPDPPTIEPAGAARAGLVEEFCGRLQSLGVTYEIAESAAVARLGLLTYLQSRNVTRVLAWADEALPIPGLHTALDTLGIVAVTPQARPLDPAPPALDAIEVGLTGADAALADTGTLVLSSGPGRPLLVSYLVRDHIVLVAQSRIFPHATAWLATLRSPRGGASPPAHAQTALITGPGQTMDIELTPAAGVHGPRHLHVVIVQDG